MAPDWNRRKRLIRALQILLSLVIVGGIFIGILPKIADYSAVWSTITNLTPVELLSLLAATIFNIVTYWPQMVASLPGLSLGQAAVNNQSTTSIANTLPAGGVLAVGVSYAMYRSWGFTDAAIALSALVTFVWNMFIKLGLPVLALALLAIGGDASAGLVVAALVGVGVLVAAVAVFALMLWKEALAERIGSAMGTWMSAVRRLFRKPAVRDWGEAAVRFREQTIQLVAGRWIPLTISTVVSHLGLYVVLLLALRHVGVSEQEVSWTQVLGVFAFIRLLSAVPITPGGLGIVELGYIGGLVLAGRGRADVDPEMFRAQVAAAVLVFRALTYGLQIPLGALTYLIWRRNRSWRKPPPAHGEHAVATPVPTPG